MSPRKAILRALLRERVRGVAHVRPPDLPGFTGRPERYQAAVNELLKERLVEGRVDAEGRMTIALNEHRLADVRDALRPLWTRPVLWATAAAALLVVMLLVSTRA